MAKVKTKEWVVTYKDAAGKLGTVTMPGGLHEAEAVRCAHYKIPKYARVQRAELVELKKA